MSTNLLEKAGEFLNLPLRTFADALPYNATFPYKRVATLAHIIEYLERKKEQARGASLKIQSSIISEMKMVQVRLQEGAEQEVWSDLSDLLEILFPEFLEGNTMGFASLPFAREFIYETPGMESFQNNERYNLQLQKTPVASWASSAVIQAGGLILNTFYGQQFDFSLSDVFAIEDKENKLVQYKRLQASTDYFRIKPLKPLPRLSGRDLQSMLENFDDPELWLHYLPASHFSFEGIVFGRMMDVTASEVNARLRERLLNPDTAEAEPEKLLPFIQYELRNYLAMPDLRFGVFQLPGSFSDAVDFKGSLLGGVEEPGEAVSNCALYSRAIRQQHPGIVENLSEYGESGVVEQRLLAAGYRSLIVSPLIDERQRTIGVIELASPVANQLNAFTLLRMKGLFSLFNSGFSRFRRQWVEQINQVIQDKFTTIHQSLRWKFEETAADYLRAGRKQNLSKVVFNDLIPLYGQADIIGSTYTRNQAARADLKANLELLLRSLRNCSQHLSLHLLESYITQAEGHLDQLEKRFSAADEPVMAYFIADEVHPFLKQLSEQHNGPVAEAIDFYFNQLDVKTEMVYDQRRKYDESLQMLNLELGQYLEREEKAMQKILPHYFNLYKTDGVEYNIYLGQSILRKGGFSDYHRKNFELWQLQCMIGMTRMVDQLQNRLPMPLQTAQLVFAYGSPISIQFRMDEKQFDVEAGVDASFEILKKRIDKAEVEGSGERLTQSGKIAVIYLQSRDQSKYLNFLNYLSRKGYLEEEIEQFTLAPLQGVVGLKALRAKVATSG